MGLHFLFRGKGLVLDARLLLSAMHPPGVRFGGWGWCFGGWGLGFRDEGLGFGVWDLVFGVWGLSVIFSMRRAGVLSRGRNLAAQALYQEVVLELLTQS